MELGEQSWGCISEEGRVMMARNMGPGRADDIRRKYNSTLRRKHCSSRGLVSRHHRQARIRQYAHGNVSLHGYKVLLQDLEPRRLIGTAPYSGSHNPLKSAKQMIISCSEHASSLQHPPSSDNSSPIV